MRNIFSITKYDTLIAHSFCSPLVLDPGCSSNSLPLNTQSYELQNVQRAWIRMWVSELPGDRAGNPEPVKQIIYAALGTVHTRDRNLQHWLKFSFDIYFKFVM